MTIKLSPWRRLRHGLIRTRWRRWLLPLICSIPYLMSLLWLLLIGEAWIAQVLLAPLLMAVVLGSLSFWLARQEFRH